VGQGNGTCPSGARAIEIIASCASMSSLQSALSIKQWDREAFASDPWGRNLYGNGRPRLLTARSVQPLAARWFSDTKIVVNALIMEIKNLSPLFSLSELSEPTERVRRSVAKLSCGRALSSRLTPATMRPNEIRESAFRAAVNAVSAATVTPGASPRAFSAALSRSSTSLSLRGLLSAMRHTHPSVPFRANSNVSSRNPKRPRTRIQPSGAALHRLRPKAQSPWALNCAACAFNPSAGSERIASSLEEPVTVPLRSRANANPFWIMLLLV